MDNTATATNQTLGKVKQDILLKELRDTKNFPQYELQGIDQTEENLLRTNLTKANLTGEDLTDANLTEAIMKRAIIEKVKVYRTQTPLGEDNSGC